MTVKVGIRKSGETSIAAMIKEFTQLDEGAKTGNPVVVPTDASKPTGEEKERYHMP